MILIDSNVLLDLYDVGSEWHQWSVGALAAAADEAPLMIDPIIYAEVSIKFKTPVEFDEAFPPEDFLRQDLPFAAAFIAGKAHTEYRRRGGVRAATLPDFFIGAHALVAGYRILTRDPRRFRRYFPTVEVIAP